MDIILDNVSKQYGEKKALSPVSACFRDGRITALVGPSGSGKSTLVRLLLGLEEPSSGRIEFVQKRQTSPDSTSTSTSRPTVSCVFQENRLISSLTVRANLKMVEDPRAPFDDALLSSYLEKFDLSPELLSRPVSELSGGMARRVALIRALLINFEILILDEPFKGLDLQTKEKVLKSMSLFWSNKTIILVTHDLSELSGLDFDTVSLNH